MELFQIRRLHPKRFPPNSKHSVEHWRLYRLPLLARSSWRSCQDSHTYDGRFANNPWLLNSLIHYRRYMTNVAPRFLTTGSGARLVGWDLVTLRVGNREVQAPALVAPGKRPHSDCKHRTREKSGNLERAPCRHQFRAPSNLQTLPRFVANLSKLGKSISLPRTQSTSAPKADPSHANLDWVNGFRRFPSCAQPEARFVERPHCVIVGHVD